MKAGCILCDTRWKREIAIAVRAESGVCARYFHEQLSVAQYCARSLQCGRDSELQHEYKRHHKSLLDCTWPLTPQSTVQHYRISIVSARVSVRSNHASSAPARCRASEPTGALSDPRALTEPPLVYLTGAPRQDSPPCDPLYHPRVVPEHADAAQGWPGAARGGSTALAWELKWHRQPPHSRCLDAVPHTRGGPGRTRRDADR